MKRKMRNMMFVCMLLLALMSGMAVAHAATVTSQQEASLYQRLGGYDAIAAVVDDLFPRLAGDRKLGRFWVHRGSDGIAREKQFLINFIVEKSGGPIYYKGRAMKVLHVGMKIDEKDWQILTLSLKKTLDKFKVAEREQQDVFAFIESTKQDIVEIK